MPKKQSKALPKSERKRLSKLVELENAARAKGYTCIVGVDEVGRGPLAGPVVAAACSIQEGIFFKGIDDSKLVAPHMRQLIYDQLVAHVGVRYGIGIVSHEEIDRLNIFHASLEAMRLAVQGLSPQPDCLLVDGKHTFSKEIYSEAIVKGDQRSQMIAAASIIAKVTRDALMVRFHEIYPEYGFAQHKGYATAMHRAALSKHGPSPIHRRTFLKSDSEQLLLFDTAIRT